MDGHHLGVDGERDVGVVAAAGAFQWDEGLLRLLLLFRLVLLFLQLLLQRGDRGSIEGAVRDAAVLESPAIEARLVVIVALSDDLSAIDDDTTVLIVQGGLEGLLEAERQISVSLHFAC